MKKFENFKENLKVLKEAGKQDLKNEFVTGGIINKFYIQFELSWKVLKELLVYEGVTEAANGSPREIIKAAYRTYDFINEEIWLSMLSERNSTSHVYDKKADASFTVLIAPGERPRTPLKIKIKERLRPQMGASNHFILFCISFIWPLFRDEN